MNLSFHHFGVACKSLDREAAAYAPLGYQAEAPDFLDPIQGVQGRFLVGGGPRIELLVAMEGRDVLDPWLKGGSRIYHQAFETPDLPAALDELRGVGARVVVQPVPAVAFGGRDICFLMLRTMSLIELISTV